jgi:hypothetical protein
MAEIKDKSVQEILEDLVAVMAKELQFKEQRLLKQKAEFERNEQFISSRQSAPSQAYMRKETSNEHSTRT